MKKIVSKNKKILFISMPFAWLYTPSIQLGILKNYLSKNDIPVETTHLYLDLLRFIDRETYDSISAVAAPFGNMLFKMLYYPTKKRKLVNEARKILDWEKSVNKYRRDERFLLNSLEQLFHSDAELDKLLVSLSQYINYCFSEIDWVQYSLVGFTCVFGQTYPSLLLSKKIKRKFKNLQIVLGGIECFQDIGIQVLKRFHFIDYVISGEGENALLELAKKIIWGENFDGSIVIQKVTGRNVVLYSKKCLNMNLLGIPDYREYFKRLKNSSHSGLINWPKFKKLMHIPLEASRGCYWGKCSYCGFNIQTRNYRCKNPRQILNEIKEQAKRTSIKTFQFTDNVFSPALIKPVFGKLTRKNFNFLLELRAPIKKEQLMLLKKVGMNNCQIGVEALNTRILKDALCRGMRFVDVLQAMKHCEELSIDHSFNIMVYLPKCEKEYILDSIKNIKYAQNYHPPGSIPIYFLSYLSEIYKNPKKYSISNKIIKDISKDLIGSPMQLFLYKYNLVGNYYEWQLLCNSIIDWKKKYKRFAYGFIKDKNYVIIYDDSKNKHSPEIKRLSGLSARLLLLCDSCMILKDICDKLSDYRTKEINTHLCQLVKNGLIFKEEDTYLSLPIDLNQALKFEKMR